MGFVPRGEVNIKERTKCTIATLKKKSTHPNQGWNGTHKSSEQIESCKRLLLIYEDIFGKGKGLSG